MTYEPRIGPDGRDDDLTRTLRQIYAAPVEEGYWSTLAQRVMSPSGISAPTVRTPERSPS